MIDTTLLEEQFPWLFESVYNVVVWAWLAIPAFAVASFILSAIICTVAKLIYGRLRKQRNSWESARHRTGLFRALQLFITGIIFSMGESLLPLGESATAVLRMAETTVFVYAVASALFILVERLCAKASYLLAKSQRRSARAVLPLLRKMAKAVIVILSLLFLLQNFGFDVATIIAGLGIGGVAIALASQKSVENLFGGITLIIDQPVRVGDFCRYDGDKIGTIEDVGLRSTRIRSLNRTLITVPNASFSQMTLENFTERDKILLWDTIGVRYDTPVATMRTIIHEIRENVLLPHEMVDEKPARVRFVKFNASSLDIELFVYINTEDWDEFLAIRETLFLDIMSLFEQHDVEIAFPSRSLYLEQGRADNVMQLDVNNTSGRQSKPPAHETT